MDLEKIESRRNVIISAVEMAKKEVIDCTEKLERAKSNFAMLNGNLNEINYFHSQLTKEAKENVKIDEQETIQVTEC